MEATGICANEFDSIKNAFEDIFKDPQERGGALCVKIGDETVVDLWAGSSDLEGNKPWNKDTLVNTFCTIKPFAAVAALMLVEEGKLELGMLRSTCRAAMAGRNSPGNQRYSLKTA